MDRVGIFVLVILLKFLQSSDGAEDVSLFVRFRDTSTQKVDVVWRLTYDTNALFRQVAVLASNGYFKCQIGSHRFIPTLLGQIVNY